MAANGKGKGCDGDVMQRRYRPPAMAGRPAQIIRTQSHRNMLFHPDLTCVSRVFAYTDILLEHRACTSYYIMHPTRDDYV